MAKKIVFENKNNIIILYKNNFYSMEKFKCFFVKVEIIPGIYIKDVYYQFRIYIENDIDDILIFYNNKLVHEQYYSDRSKYILEFGFSNMIKLKEIDHMDVYVKDIYVKEGWGGDINRCELKRIQNYFDVLGYQFMSDNSKVEISSINKSLLKICEESRSCSNKINKFDINLCIRPYYDCIELYEYGNKYFVKSGNHRICVAIKLGIDKIPAKIIKIKYDYNFNNILNKINRNNKIDYKSAINLVENYYRALERLKIDKKTAKRIIKGELSFEDFINLIEIRNNKNIYELSCEI